MLDNLDKETKNLLKGALILGAVGLGASLLIRSGHGKKQACMHSIEKIVCRVSEALEKSGREGKSIVQEAEKKICKEENVILSAIDLATAGISLWKKLKKAG